MKIVKEGITYYLGKWPGRCVAIDDPNQGGRIRAMVPDVYGTVSSPWATPCFPGGDFKVPSLGDQVWFEFQSGDPEQPIFVGYAPSAAGGAQAAPGTARGDDDDTTLLLGGKGGGAMDIADDEDGTRQVLEPATTSQPQYGHVKSLRVGMTFMEVDGTADNQRIQMYHDSGAFMEIGKGGGFKKVMKGQEHDWVKGTRTRVTTSQLTETVGANAQYDYSASVKYTFGGDRNITQKGDTFLESEGSLSETLGGGKVVDVSGQYSISAASVKDVCAGDRSVATLGKLDEVVTGSVNVLIANGSFDEGWTIGYNLGVALGDMLFTTLAGNVFVTTAPGPGTINLTTVNGAMNLTTGAGVMNLTTGAGVMNLSTGTGVLNVTSGAALNLTGAAVVTVNGTQILLGLGAAENVIGGLKFQALWNLMVTWLNTHVHKANAEFAPVDPPTIPLTSDITPALSQLVKVGL